MTRIEDDVAFAITSGYYPKIASNIFYSMRASSRGSTGSKYSQVQGWSEYSLKKAKFERPQGYEGRLRDDKGRLMPEILAHRKAIFEGQRGTVKTEAVGGLRKGKLPQVKDRDVQRKDYRPPSYKTKGGKEVPWPEHWKSIENYKWIGGSSEYKLYGDQVWYMHGKTPGGGAKVMDEFLTGLSDGKKGQQKIAPAFQNIYSKTEPHLTEKALLMADKVFKGALKEIKAGAEEIMQGDYGAGSTEEIGFETDEYKYMPHSSAKNAKDEHGNFSYRDQLDDMIAGSHANPRDMVKINKETGRIERIFDVTEMPLGKKGQHGIVETPPELLKAIEDAKKGGSLKELREKVESMFIKAIKNDYNPTIQRIKKSTEEAYKERTGGKKRRTTNFAQVIKEIRQETGKWNKSGKKGRVSVNDIGNFANMKLVDHARRAHYKNAFSETGLRYVTHMLASWGKKVGNEYTQAHRVFDIPNGESVFAYTKMHQYASGDRIMEFSETAPKGEENTFLRTGYNSTMALEANTKQGQSVNWRLKSLAQKRAWMHRWMSGHTHTKLGQIRSAVSNHPGAKPQSTTQVFLPQRQEMNDFLIQALETAITGKGWKAKAEKLLPNLQKQLEHNRYSYNPAKGGWKKKLRRGGDKGKPAFWALPYLGIMTSEHIKRAEKKK